MWMSEVWTRQQKATTTTRNITQKRFPTAGLQRRLFAALPWWPPHVQLVNLQALPIQPAEPRLGLGTASAQRLGCPMHDKRLASSWFTRARSAADLATWTHRCCTHARSARRWAVLTPSSAASVPLLSSSTPSSPLSRILWPELSGTLPVLALSAFGKRWCPHWPPPCRLRGDRRPTWVESHHLRASSILCYSMLWLKGFLFPVPLKSRFLKPTNHFLVPPFSWLTSGFLSWTKRSTEGTWRYVMLLLSRSLLQRQFRSFIRTCAKYTCIYWTTKLCPEVYYRWELSSSLLFFAQYQVLMDCTSSSLLITHVPNLRPGWTLLIITGERS
jgi:hypothetical protein